MQTLWSPWRNQYIASAGSDSETGVCVFCAIQEEPAKDESNLIVYRGAHNYIVLNRYPYITGHLLLVPYAHIADLDAAAKEITDELMDLTKRSQTILREVYRPAGFNMGINLGNAAGAGVTGHLHIHVLPRWNGDTNFMTTVGETRVIPEDLTTTYQKLQKPFSNR